MLGGPNGNSTYPGFMEENRALYDNATLPQFQLFGHAIKESPPRTNKWFTHSLARLIHSYSSAQSSCSTPYNPMLGGAQITTTNYTEKECAPTVNLPTKRVRRGESVFTQQKLQISLNNNNLCPDESGNIVTLLNPTNHVSTGLRLSHDEDERNASLSSAFDNIRTSLPANLSMTVKMEMDRHTEEISRYIKLQEENILKGVRELNQRHTVSLLNTFEKGVNQKLHEKDLEKANIKCKNNELGDRIKHVVMEAQSWHYRAKYNESVINVLKSNIQQLMVQGAAQAYEGSGKSEVDDTASGTNHQGIMKSGSRNQLLQNYQLKCRACKVKEVCVLVLPCRHLCLCTDCEVFIDACPVCQVMRTASVHVCM